MLWKKANSKALILNLKFKTYYRFNSKLKMRKNNY